MNNHLVESGHVQVSRRATIGVTHAILIFIFLVMAGAAGFASLIPQSGRPVSVITQSGTSACVITTEGTGLYVTVHSDMGQPIQGAQVSGIRVTQVNGGICQQNIGIFFTNSTGAVLITPNIGSYYTLVIRYQGESYTVKALIEPMKTTYVTLRVPSGNFSISEIAYGGCQRTSNGITCPG